MITTTTKPLSPKVSYITRHALTYGPPLGDLCDLLDGPARLRNSPVDPSPKLSIGGLALYELPPGAVSDYVSRLYRELLTRTAIHSRLRQRTDPVGSLGNVWWTEERDLDLEYHARGAENRAAG